MAAPLAPLKPSESIPQDLLVYLYSVKEALDKLWDNVITQDNFSGLSVSEQRLKASAATGAGVRIPNGPFAASSQDHAQLVGEVKALIQDVASLNASLVAVVARLKGST